jgi:hypothetical protein
MVEENEVFWKSLLDPIQCNHRGQMDKCNDGSGLPCCFYCPQNEKCYRMLDGEYASRSCLSEKREEGRYSTCGRYIQFLKEKRKNDKKP